MKKLPPFFIRRTVALFLVAIVIVCTLGPKILGVIILFIILAIILFGSKFYLGILLTLFFIAFLIALVYSENWYSQWRDDK